MIETQNRYKQILKRKRNVFFKFRPEKTILKMSVKLPPNNHNQRCRQLFYMKTKKKYVSEVFIYIYIIFFFIVCQCLSESRFLLQFQ